MNMLKYTLFLASNLFFFLACNNSGQQNQDSQGKNDETKSDNSIEIKEHNVNSIQQATASDVVNYYLQIKYALVKSDGEEAARSAEALHVVVKEKEESILKKIRDLSFQISDTDDLETQRKAFFQLSNYVYQIAVAINTGEGKIYKQYCPMARDNEGAFWLSKEEEIMNPYFGNKMLHCGKVQETI